MKSIFALTLLFILSFQLQAQTIIGQWKTFEDGKPSSIIKIYKAKNGKYYGKMVEILDPKLAQHTCDKCPGDRQGKPTQDLIVMRDLEISADQKSAEDGKILDPWKGKEYNCKVWLENPNQLKMRAYVGFLYGTRTWQRVN